MRWLSFVQAYPEKKERDRVLWGLLGNLVNTVANTAQNAVTVTLP